MSRAEMRIECPNCNDRAVDVVPDGGSANGESRGSSRAKRSDGGELDPTFRDSDRLTGTTAGCSNCGNEFDVYFY